MDPSDLDDLHQANAKLFVVDLHNNPQLNQQWTSLLTQINAKLSGADADTLKRKLTVVANFIVNKGYNTTPDDVLNLLKVKWYEDYQAQFQPNPDSDRFAQAILGNPKLLGGWQEVLQAASSGSDPDAPNNFLKAQNFNCNKDQVNASIRANRDHALSWWAGIYGNTVVTFKGNSKGKPGPIITVYDDRQFGVGGNVVDWQLNQVTYQDGQLTWKIDDFQSIPMSGNLTFAQVSRPALNDPYVGNEFFGTLTYPDDGQGFQGTVNIMGRIGKPQQALSSQSKPATPPTVKLDAVQEIMKYIGYAMAAVFVIDLIASVPKRIKAIKDFFSKDDTKAGKSLNEQVDQADSTSPDEIAESSAPEQTDPSSIDGTDPGIDAIPDENLPPAEDLEQMENASEAIDEQNGEMTESEENVPETEEGTNIGEEATGAEAESTLSELGEFL